MQIWAESGKSALPICNYSQILYQFLTFTQNLKRSQNIFNVSGFDSRTKHYSYNMQIINLLLTFAYCIDYA